MKTLEHLKIVGNDAIRIEKSDSWQRSSQPIIIWLLAQWRCRTSVKRRGWTVLINIMPASQPIPINSYLLKLDRLPGTNWSSTAELNASNLNIPLNYLTWTYKPTTSSSCFSVFIYLKSYAENSHFGSVRIYTTRYSIIRIFMISVLCACLFI